MIWNGSYASLLLCGMSGAALWFVLPKKWLVRSAIATEILPRELPPPWSALNGFGKLLHVTFICSGGVLLVLLAVGALLEITGS